MEKQRNKVILVTTKGCAGCAIIRKLINEALEMYHNNAIFEDYDVSEVDKKFINTNHITDFPTVLLIKDNVTMFKFVGTKPAIIIHRWLKVNFG